MYNIMDMHRKNSHVTDNLYGDSIVHTSTFHQSQMTPILGPPLDHTYYQNFKKLIITLGLDFLPSTYFLTFWRVSKMNIHFHFSSTYAWIPTQVLLSIVVTSTTNIEMNLVTFKPSFNLLITIIVISHLMELFQCFLGLCVNFKNANKLSSFHICHWSTLI